MRQGIKPDPRRAALAALFLLCCAAPVPARQMGATAAKDAPASVAGRVTREEDNKSAPGVAVTLTASDPATRFKVVARATTDAEGRYRLANVPPGRYQLAPMAPAYVVKDSSWSGWPPGRPVTVAPGENMEDVDFRLARGGVITGRVTDADGKPIVAERVEITPVDKQQVTGTNWFSGMRNLTDDRGVYRLYGLAAGRYHVSIGQDKDTGVVHIGGPNRYYRRTYHPAATDVAQAQVVEVKPGDEAKDVDIVAASAVKTFKAAGRIVSAETGQPVPDVMFAHGALRKGEKMIGGYGMTGVRTNARGEFTVEGLAPGHYAVFAISHEPADWYSDAVAFEVEEADVSGLEVKLRRGASLGGVVLLEGVSDPAARAQLLLQAQLYASAGSRDELTAPNYLGGKINPDGTFRFGGLRPGQYKIALSTWRAPQGLSLVRVEQNGVSVSGGIEVAEGAQVTGVRVHLAYGTSVVRGQVTTAAGAPAPAPPGARMTVHARRVIGGHAEATQARSTEVDVRGRFIIEGLSAGEYLIVLRVTAPGAEAIDVRQTVTVSDGGETSVVLVLK
ncbi:MAG TPA: carboxypeptidase-like regulatory domain-containing protein [Pyrinomonadaceae bacterium]